MNFVGRNILFILTILMVGMIACGGDGGVKEESQDAFYNRFAKLVDLGDEVKLYDECFVRNKPDMRKMIAQYGASTNVEKDIEMMYQMLSAQESRLIAHLNGEGLEDWSSLRVESMSRTNLPKRDKEQNIIPVDPGYQRVEFLYNVINNKGKRFQFLFHVVDLNEGKWKFYRGPVIKPE